MLRLHNSYSLTLLLLLASLFSQFHTKSLVGLSHEETNNDMVSVGDEVSDSTNEEGIELTTVGDAERLTEAYSATGVEIEVDEIMEFEEIKESILSIVKPLKSETAELVEIEELLKIEKMIEALDEEELTEKHLDNLKDQILNSYLEIDDEYRAKVLASFDNFEKYLQSRQKADHHQMEELEEVWEPEEEGGSDSVTTSENLNIIDKFKTRNIFDKHTHTHTVEASPSLKSLSLDPYLTPVMIMVVFILVCAVLAYKVSRKTRRTSKLVSQGMAKDLGYTQLETVVEEEEDSLLKNQQFRNQYKIQ